MTRPARSAVLRAGGYILDADTPVLLNRALRPDVAPADLSRFAEDRWKLSPAIHEKHYESKSLNFALVPESFRRIAKAYVWLELNGDHDVTVLRRASFKGQLSVTSMHNHLRMVRVFLDWLDHHAITTLEAVTTSDLDRFLDAVRDAPIREAERFDVIQAVRRLWAMREALPPEARLPQEPPWNGKEARFLLGPLRRPAENLTPRIPETTMSLMLCWALRFVEDFSDDITAARAEYRTLVGRTRPTYPAPTSNRHASFADAATRIDALISEFRSRGEPLPGKRTAEGVLEPHWAHLGRLTGLDYQLLERDGPHRKTILDAGMPVAEAAHLQRHPTGLLDDRPWRSRIDYDDVKDLVHALYAACFTVIAYLSGMRPGEILSLERDCVTYDPTSRLWLLRGLRWKNATDADGTKIPEGQYREDPWVVIEPVARAVAVLEQLTDTAVLFPSRLVWTRKPHDRDGARTGAEITKDLARFTDWVNAYCRDHDRTDMIPTPARAIAPSQFRRTLAWFICRRPRGLVAAAIQYGHLHVQITQGYGGNYASGFPDDLAFEQWLARLDELDEAERRLSDGEHVSGPAADAYRSRVGGGSSRFAGRVIRGGRQARHILANPSLQIYPGQAMTCVFNAATALCELVPSTDDARHTPDTTDCRPTCRNIARTDNDMVAVRTEATELRAVVADSASPAIRLARHRQRLHHLDKILTDHSDSRDESADRP
ncbi:site-specific integrase [Nocardia noduli]|uniref:site-specific integrase n=1 Tax=Nocardia noduli TaxID=2815722 RepID=UPI001C217900|nr:site-specific integrase [Nocardia noduli]